MIDLGSYERCACAGRNNPNSLCGGELILEEKGKKVQLRPRRGERAKAVVIDGCVCTDNQTKCDGLFLLRGSNNMHYMILVELKGSDIPHAFEQLAYVRYERAEYKEIESLFMTGERGQPNHLAFIVSNRMISPPEIQKLEKKKNIRVRKILLSKVTSKIEDIREYIK